MTVLPVVYARPVDGWTFAVTLTLASSLSPWFWNVTASAMPAVTVTRDGWAAGVAKRPVLERYVSANVAPARDGLVAPATYVVRQAGGVRVGITGVSQPNAKLEGACGYRVTDAAAALAAVLPKVRAESDVVVVMAYMQPAAVEALAAAVPGKADVWIAANSIGGDVPPPKLDGPERVTSSWYKTQMLGVLSVRMDGRRVAGVTNEYVKLEDPVPRDAAMERYAASSREAVRAVKERRFAADQR